MPTGATTSRLRVTLLSLLRQTDELIVAIATKRPAPKDSVYTAAHSGPIFHMVLQKGVCVRACARHHRTPQDTGAPSSSHSCNPSGSPALKSLCLAP